MTEFGWFLGGLAIGQVLGLAIGYHWRQWDENNRRKHIQRCIDEHEETIWGKDVSQFHKKQGGPW